MDTRYCTSCGQPLKSGASFCSRCGAKVRSDAVAPAANARTAAAPTSLAETVRRTQQMVGTTASIAGVAGSVGALGWQTVVKGERPDLSQFLARGVAPVAQQVVRRSIRRPAVALIVTTLLDAFVAWVTGQPAALTASGLRLASGLGTGLLGMITGKRGGVLRAITGIGSLVTTALQGYNAVALLLAAVGRGTSLLSLIPSIVSTASVIFVGVRLAITTFRSLRRS